MIWVREKIIFRYEFGMWLVLVVGEVGKKSAPFLWGLPGCHRSDGVLYHSRQNCIFSPWTLAFVIEFMEQDCRSSFAFLGWNVRERVF